MTGPLISAAELRDVLATVTALDVRYRMGGPPGPAEHAAGHVPGAAYVDLDTELAGPPADPVGDDGRHPLPQVPDFQAAMRRAGVGTDGPVVVYDDWQGRAAGRAWWLLRHHGHRDVRVLDGGWSAWVAAGGRVETGSGVATQPGDFTAGPGVLPTIGPDRLHDAPLVVDARAGIRFRGETEPVDPVAGHVPGAVNVPTEANLVDDGRFRSVEELRAVYAAAGVLLDAPTGSEPEVAVYCGSGVTATHDLIALELIGVPAVLYPGSWSGWVSDAGREVETG